jgi:hypothetical protein
MEGWVGVNHLKIPVIHLAKTVQLFYNRGAIIAFSLP